MKKLIKMSGYILATMMVLLISQLSVFAADGSSNQGSSLTGAQVFGGFAVLVLVILLPLFKKSNKKEII
jgi:hypothetical protein